MLAKDVVNWAGRFLGDFLCCNGVDQSPILKTLPTRHSWKPPCSGFVKINVDAAVWDEMDIIGIGVVVRDETGALLGAMAGRVFGCFSPFLGECIAVREGAFFAQMGGLDDWTIESDVVNVVRAIQSPVT
ncbi:hypothetical protein TIFTF001_036205 [Ficus carica]|uniref:RNase H type-1 domain-containing protein n=1 Tax=Ficus carica TaxID=3494 RepID=A0AA88E2W8_FICCA|nr:hypothetical protein TIFTF001_036205 [Ficus carica]